MNKIVPISIAYGDGIGPEIMRATLKILDAAKVSLEFEPIEVGEKVYLQGYSSGIPDEAWKSLKRTKVLLKGPITTPQGKGYKSLNVTLRKVLQLFANVRPSVSYAPFVPTIFPNINLVLIRENEEDTYTGIEYRETDDSFVCLKIITREGCEQIIRYAFEYAKKLNRKKVTCLSKDNIMKMTDGLFHRVFDEIAAEYPNILHDHLIVDIGTAMIATQPERFDVIVTLNLYGDILSDVIAQVSGSVGLAGSANVGKEMAMFEAIHGSAPSIAGKNIANPSGLLNAAIQMLVYLNQYESASLIENAWLTTLEDGIHTGDIFSPAHSKEKVGTQEFADAVIARLGKQPSHFKASNYQGETKVTMPKEKPARRCVKKLIGMDVTIANEKNLSVEDIASQCAALKGPLELVVMVSKGLKIWPQSPIDNPYRKNVSLRFQCIKEESSLTQEDTLDLLQQMNKLNFSVIKTENLFKYDDEPGFSLAQGE